MSDYTQITFFAPKDALGTGNPSKLIKGTEVDPELLAISTAIATKFDANDISDNTAAAALASDAVLITPAKLKYAVENGVILYNINGLTAFASAANANNDYLPIYVAGTGVRKINPTNLIASTGFVPNTRTITSGNGLSGGGDLSANRTLAVGAGLGIVVNADTVEVDEGASLTYNGNQLEVSRTNATTTDAVGFMDIPQNSQTTNYTTVMDDRGKMIFHPSGAGAGDTFTIAANASVAYPTGSVITFFNEDSNNLSITVGGSDNLYLAGTTTTGTRTLGQRGLATAIKIGGVTWVISGVGLS